MRRYNPFVSSPTPDATPSTTSDTAPPSPPASPSCTSYLPTVPALPALPALPSVRKYLPFASSPSDPPPTPAPPSAHVDAAAELSTLVASEFGPVGLPSRALSGSGADRLAATLHAGPQERDRLLRQFLRARQHNAHEALAMIRAALHWRSSMSIHLYLTHSAANMVKPDACFPMHIISTPNRCKQPVVYGLIRLLDKKKVDKAPFTDALLSFLESIYFGDTYVLDEMIIILDFRDWSIRRNAPYRLVKDGIQTLQDYYPERLGRVFLVNYPTSIRAAYTAISPIIDAGAKEKIVWVGDADPSATLRRFVAPKSIPSFMGGELEACFPSTWPDIAAEFGPIGRTRLHA